MILLQIRFSTQRYERFLKTMHGLGSAVTRSPGQRVPQNMLRKH